MPRNKLFPLSDTKFGMTNSPDIIFLYNYDVFGSSNGRYPHIIAYKIIPHDQISVYNPLYLFPATI